MIIKKRMLIYFLLIITYSCSSVKYSDTIDRIPAQSTSTNLDSLLSFKVLGKKRNNNLRPQVEGWLNDSLVSSFIAQEKTKKNLKIEYVESKKLPKDTAFKVEFDVIDEKFVYRILYSPNAFYYEEPVQLIVNFVSNLISGARLLSSWSPFELFYNAREGHLESIQNLLKIRFHASEVMEGIQLSDLFEVVLERSKADFEEINSELESQIKINKAKVKSADAKRKAILDSLDKASQDKQLKFLIAKNDRIAAAELIRNYLPFEDMAPFEKRFWENYLEIIKNPLPIHQRVLIYRGVDDDLINPAFVKGEILSKEDAIKESKVFFMSTVLTKNQGTYNRRLRSLEAMNKKTIGTIGGNEEYSKSARISTMFRNHSLDPVGSPFLSLTPAVETARTFGSRKDAAFLIDPRAIFFNFTSTYDQEVEYLVGLMTFPDEMVGFWHIENNGIEDMEKYFTRKLLEKVEYEYGKIDKVKIVNEIQKNSNDFFKEIYSTGNTAKSNHFGTAAEFFKMHSSGKSEIPSPVFDSNGNYSCAMLLKILWAK